MVLLLACHKAPPDAAAPAPAPAAPTPAAETDRDRVLRALSARDTVDCATVEAMTADPVATLLDVVATVRLPPSAPMRAAGCLLDRHAAEASEAIVGWMGAAETRGLAELAASRLDTLPAELALRVAQAGLGGANAEVVREHVTGSTRTEIRALTR